MDASVIREFPGNGENILIFIIFNIKYLINFTATISVDSEIRKLSIVP